ncbi:MAG: hypothetical protein Q9214_003232 [Letrouitia sp. 1 TL-2023]
MHQSQQPNQHNSQIASIGHFTQQQQPVPGVRVTTAELRPTTRFNDLHEQLQTLIENVDNFIQQQMKYQQECASFNLHLETNSGQIPYDVELCTRSLETMQQALENDAEAISYAKDLTKIDIANAKLSIDVIQSMRMPPQFQQSNIWTLPANSQDMTLSLLAEGSEETGINASLVSYFSKQVDNMSKSLSSYKKNIAEVESYLKGVEADTINQMQQVLMTQTHNGHIRSADDQVRELAAVLKDFENGILGVASKVGGVREQVQEVMLGD